MPGKIKNLVFVSYHIHSNPGYRPSMLHRFFLDQQTKFKSYHLLAANWDHQSKAKHDLEKFPEPNINWIKVPSYTKNISLRRVLSYLSFSLKLIFSKKLWKADLVVISVPPSFSAVIPGTIAMLRGKPWVVDIVDLWPEALPVSPSTKKLFMRTLGKPWVWSRNFFYSRASLFISHSKYFLGFTKTKTKKSLWLPLMQTGTIPQAPHKRAPIDQEIRICVLGSINNVLNIDSLVVLTAEIQKLVKQSGNPRKLVLEILGGGERKETLIKEIQMAAPKWKIQDHGISFDPDLKQSILNRCHFGYNGYRSTTAIGITYKSIDFASFGNVFLNSVQGDLKSLVVQYLAGFNFQLGGETALAEEICDLSNNEYIKLSKGSHHLATDLFSRSRFERRLAEALERVSS